MQRVGIWLILLAATAVSACSQTDGMSPTAPTTGTVVSLSLSAAPMSNGVIQVSAISHFTDGTTQDVTRTSQWDTSNPQIASVSQQGIVTPLGTGDVDVHATYVGITGTTHLSVAPPAVTSVVIAGAAASGSFQLTATATRANNSSANITSAAIWSSSDPHIALVSSIGFVTVLADGAVDITATFEGVTGTLHATVSVPKIYSIAGTITDATTNQPISGAHVQVLGGPGATTDTTGKYTVSQVAEGRTLVEISAAGYDVAERDLMVESDTTLSVGLTPTKTEGT
jgi:hypothetical protein